MINLFLGGTYTKGRYIKQAQKQCYIKKEGYVKIAKNEECGTHKIGISCRVSFVKRWNVSIHVRHVHITYASRV